jgi:hypothetical protein
VVPTCREHCELQSRQVLSRAAVQFPCWYLPMCWCAGHIGDSSCLRVVVLLQHATPALEARAAAAGGRPPGSTFGSSSGMFGAGASSALSGLQSRLESSLSALGLKLPAGREEAEDPLAPFLSEWAAPV